MTGLHCTQVVDHFIVLNRNVLKKWRIELLCSVLGTHTTVQWEIFARQKFFAIFAIKHQLAKICSHENFSRENFSLHKLLADNESSTVPSSRDPVNRRKVDLFCRRSIEQTAEIFRDLRSTRRNCEQIIEVSSLPLAWQFFADSDQHALISVEILLSFQRYTQWVTISMREIVGGVDRHHDLVTKIEIAKFISQRVCW